MRSHPTPKPTHPISTARPGRLPTVALAALLILLPIAAFAYLQSQSHNKPRMQGKDLLVELETPGGPLPIFIRLRTLHDTGFAAIRTGDDWVDIQRDDITLTSSPETQALTSLTIDFPHYDSVLQLAGQDDGPLTGQWTKNRGLNDDGSPKVATLSAAARPHDHADPLFAPIPSDASPSDLSPSFTGRWAVNFAKSDDLAIGVFNVNDDRSATGTFLTTTGDYRHLAGQVDKLPDGDLLRLATFDGAHAFLFHIRMQPDGTITGDFWSGNWYHDTFTAARDDTAELPDPFLETSLSEGIDLSDLAFTDLEGNPVRLTDALNNQGGKARIIELFGTWCPNCADAAKELRRLKNIHRDNLGIVALAFEFTDDLDRSATQIRRYKQRHGLEDSADWPVLIAGVSDKAKATESVRLLDKVRSYPTTLFLNASNEVVAIHTGFTGPATGDAFTQQQARWEAIINDLIESE